MRKELVEHSSRMLSLTKSTYDSYSVIIDVCLLVELFLELGVLLDRPTKGVSSLSDGEVLDTSR